MGPEPWTGKKKKKEKTGLVYFSVNKNEEVFPPFVFTPRARPPGPHPTAHPHLGPKRVSLPYFTHDHVVGALCPPSPDPALSTLTWV